MDVDDLSDLPLLTGTLTRPLFYSVLLTAVALVLQFSLQIGDIQRSNLCTKCKVNPRKKLPLSPLQ